MLIILVGEERSYSGTCPAVERYEERELHFIARVHEDTLIYGPECRVESSPFLPSEQLLDLSGVGD